MITLQRHPKNPILAPNPKNAWEAEGAFNGSITKGPDGYHMVFRALSATQKHEGRDMQVSSVGYAFSEDGITFGEHRQLFGPEEHWEMYGCEDPRITYFNGKYYIFYTALSVFPFTAYGIKLAVAITKDFKTFEKHPVTTFNSKAMGLFPEKVNGKMAAILTMHTDMPPAKIAIAYFDKEEDMWDPAYWEEWYHNANDHIVPLLRDMRDQVELGAVPVKTDKGWLVIYSYIKKYLTNEKEFGIEAILLESDNPTKILGRTEDPLLMPETKYEKEGVVANIVFPTGALIEDDQLYVYYGAADKFCCLANCDLASLVHQLKPAHHTDTSQQYELRFHRFPENPILTPILELEWQAAGIFNPAAIYEGGKVHIVYRAQSLDGTSTFGYASSKDGFHIDENLDYPIYVPREPFESKSHPGNSGCEDPRITRIEDKLYMTYTAYDGNNPPRVALTTIDVDDFLSKKWNWSTPILISPPGADDKDSCIVKGEKLGTYIAFHRLDGAIWVDVLDSLDLGKDKFLTGEIIARARKEHWDNAKLGIAAPPIKTDAGWLLLYHGVSYPGNIYKVGAMLLDLMNPTQVLSRTDYPLFGPETPYEIKGQIGNVVFPCGAVVLHNTIFIYYGGADTVTGVATLSLQDLLTVLRQR